MVAMILLIASIATTVLTDILILMSITVSLFGRAGLGGCYFSIDTSNIRIRAPYVKRELLRVMFVRGSPQLLASWERAYN